MDNVLLPWTIATTILLFVGAYWVYTLDRHLKELTARYEHLMALAEDADEATLASLLKRLEDQGVRLDEAWALLEQLQALMPHVIQGHGIVRYQAFANVGGDQSFSLALVDAEGNGAVITGLHGREVRVYGKPLTQWRSSYSLSAEEQEALGHARRMVEGG